jgi:apolipoprotein N-acyltransferase
MITMQDENSTLDYAPATPTPELRSTQLAYGSLVLFGIFVIAAAEIWLEPSSWGFNQITATAAVLAIFAPPLGLLLAGISFFLKRRNIVLSIVASTASASACGVVLWTISNIATC